MDEAGGKNDASSECLDDEKYIDFGAEGRDPLAQTPMPPLVRIEKMAAILRPWVEDLSWRAEDSLEVRWKRPGIEMRVNLSNILKF